MRHLRWAGRLVVWGAFFVVSPLYAQEDEAALRHAAAQVQKNVEQIYGAPFPRPVRVEIIGRGEVGAILSEEIDREISPAEMRFRQEAMRRFGLLPPDCDLRRTLLELFAEQVEGFYIPRQRALYLIKGLPFQDMLIAHELVHALQDQLVDLYALQQARRHDDDAAAALQAVAEGQAVLAMNAYGRRFVSRWSMMFDGLVASLSLASRTERLRAAPLALREGLFFPYFKGMPFVMRAWRDNGLASSFRLFERLPESTEQILWPAKYYKQPDRPTGLDLGEAAAALGEGWRCLGAQTLGEFGVRLLARSLGADENAAATMASGWDGDRFVLCEREAEHGIRHGLIWLSTWDTAAAAERFCRLYAALLKRRLPEAKQRREKGRWLWENGAAGTARYLCCWEREVVYIDGLDEGERNRIRAFLTCLLYTSPSPRDS